MIGIIDVEKFREDIICVWNEAFGDEREYIEFFLDRCPEKAAIGCVENGLLVSVLFLLDGSIEDFGCKYLYAACTLKSCRGRGIMKELIDFAKAYYAHKDVDFIFLVPGEESLYGYYKKLGFVEKFMRAGYRIRGKKDAESEPINWCVDVKAACKRRLRLLKNQPSFCFSEAVTLYVIDEFLNGGGKIYSDGEGLAFVLQNGESCLVKEYLSEKSGFFALNLQLFQKLTSENIYIQTPLVYNSRNNGCLCTKCGMLYPISERAKVYTDSIENIYSGMYLD